jgi:6-phospho-beta-glucosidase
MKTVIVGGSAFSTPALFAYLACQPGSDGLNVTLVGRSQERVLAVERAAKLICEGRPISVTSSTMSAELLVNALNGAGLVLVQVRPGGHIERAMDEVFPRRYQLCGDEGLGIGGLRAAWRVWPTVQQLLNVVTEVCPNALVALLTAPLSLVVRMAHSCFPGMDVVGVCELPWATLKTLAHKAGVNPEEIDFDYVGVNHLGWFYRIKSGSRDLVDEYAARTELRHSFPPALLVRSLSAIPTSYLRLHYFPQETLAENTRQAKSRGEQLHELSERIPAIYQRGTRQQIMASLDLRPAPWYADVVGPLILARYVGRPSIPLFLTVMNSGYNPAFLSDDVLEIPHRYEEKKPVRQPLKVKPPAHIHESLAKFVGFERVAADAIRRRDLHQLGVAMALHPWIKDARMIPAMIRDITENNVAG